jgi:hypothetical protein
MLCSYVSEKHRLLLDMNALATHYSSLHFAATRDFSAEWFMILQMFDCIDWVSAPKQLQGCAVPTYAHGS